MSGEVVYVPPQPDHECQHPAGRGNAVSPVGAVWRCECGAYWRFDALPLMPFANWHRLSGLRLWWWKRRHGGAP